MKRLFAQMIFSVIFLESAHGSVSNELFTVKACAKYLNRTDFFKNPSLDIVKDVKITDSGKIKSVSITIQNADLILDPSKPTTKADCIIRSWFTYDGTNTQCDDCDGQVNCSCWSAWCSIATGRIVIR